MSRTMPKTFWKRKEDVERTWHHFDATEQVLGRLAVKAARLLMGKDKPDITPGVDTGDYVVVTNAEKIRVTGQKAAKKVYRRHTGYVGGLVEDSYEDILADKPERIIAFAVKRMLPKTKLGRAMFKRLRVYAGAEHPHGSAQNG